jgi:hypothetical protein
VNPNNEGGTRERGTWMDWSMGGRTWPTAWGPWPSSWRSWWSPSRDLRPEQQESESNAARRGRERGAGWMVTSRVPGEGLPVALAVHLDVDAYRHQVVPRRPEKHGGSKAQASGWAATTSNRSPNETEEDCLFTEKERERTCGSWRRRAWRRRGWPSSSLSPAVGGSFLLFAAPTGAGADGRRSRGEERRKTGRGSLCSSGRAVGEEISCYVDRDPVRLTKIRLIYLGFLIEEYILKYKY